MKGLAFAAGPLYDRSRAGAAGKPVIITLASDRPRFPVIHPRPAAAGELNGQMVLARPVHRAVLNSGSGVAGLSGVAGDECHRPGGRLAMRFLVEFAIGMAIAAAALFALISWLEIASPYATYWMVIGLCAG